MDEEGERDASAHGGERRDGKRKYVGGSCGWEGARDVRVAV